jgi:hypothetical protein
VALLEGVAGEFQVVDAVEGGWHRLLCRGACHYEPKILSDHIDLRLVIVICP